jgi:uncharacterized protein GlcG (DUF336 family)
MQVVAKRRSWTAARLISLTAVLGIMACGSDSTSPSAIDKPLLGSTTKLTSTQVWTLLKAALDSAQSTANGGFGLNMWGTIVNADGIVVAVAYTGTGENDQWPGSRVISAQKANTAWDFSLPGLALSTANLYSATQPGGSLYGLSTSNPVNTDAAYGGETSQYGTTSDYMVGKRIGGINTFGGGFALYDSTGALIGGVGVSGDASCADHNIGWKVRAILQADFVPAGVDPIVTVTGHTDDNIVYDITYNAGDPEGVSASGWGHPECGSSMTSIGLALPTTYPIEYVGGGGEQRVQRARKVK